MRLAVIFQLPHLPAILPFWTSRSLWWDLQRGGLIGGSLFSRLWQAILSVKPPWKQHDKSLARALRRQMSTTIDKAIHRFLEQTQFISIVLIDKAKNVPEKERSFWIFYEIYGLFWFKSKCKPKRLCHRRYILNMCRIHIPWKMPEELGHIQYPMATAHAEPKKFEKSTSRNWCTNPAGLWWRLGCKGHEIYMQAQQKPSN